MISEETNFKVISLLWISWNCIFNLKTNKRFHSKKKVLQLWAQSARERERERERENLKNATSGRL